ncbi:MAG: OmpA family protein [Saprospiraceae bacterium]|nr:OmpA family protein [Saprospiraceae bacterium]
MKNLLFTITLFFISSIFNTYYCQQASQNSLDPVFGPFKGMSYSMPIVEKKIGNRTSKTIQQSYGRNITDYPKLGVITLKEINVPETVIGQDFFPGVDRTTQFCMLLYSTFEVKRDAFYEFSLTSDDGSILWIDGAEVVNNDGGHQMRVKKDTFFLREGTYPAKLWYFQGLPDRFGLTLNVKPVPKPKFEKYLISVKKFELNTTLLFDTNTSELNPQGRKAFNDFIEEIHKTDFTRITVIGHTDDVGEASYNLNLSKKRAETIADLLRASFNDSSIKIDSMGKGESDPKAKGTDPSARAQNRRVEIILNN